MPPLHAAAMATATATLLLRFLPSRSLTFTSLPSARCSLSVAAVAHRRWQLRAAAEEVPEAVEVEFVEPEEEEPAVPEPVEAQLAAAGAGKDADIFAVVMVGSLSRTQ